MIDFHSHILPGIDDGSPDVETSLRMLQSLKSQGVDIVAATSHFYLDRRSPQRFLARRLEAWERLQPALPEDAPRILLGAEVLYFPGISHLDELPLLCLEGTELLLLEMPFTHWSEHMIQEVRELARSGRCTVLLAHVERYPSMQKRAVWESLLDNGVLMQANADLFVGRFSRRRGLRMLDEGRIHVLGTDCHNNDSRAPHMREAMEAIRAALGSRALRDMDALGRELLGDFVE